jgi:hypothetical protein
MAKKANKPQYAGQANAATTIAAIRQRGTKKICPYIYHGR